MKTKDYSELFKVKLNNNDICRIKLFSLDKKTFESLSQYLQENNITKINLYDNKIEDEGLKFLAELLKTNSTLTSIDLRINYIGDEGVEFLAEALKENNTLTSIDLASNNIGAEGVEFLAKALKKTTL